MSTSTRATKSKTARSRRRGTRPVGDSVDHGQRRKVIVEELLKDIFHGRLKAGQRLVITSLAARFGVSQSPIREALVTLEGIGIVDIEPNCGAVVRRVTASDVREICEVRRALECMAARQACGRITYSELQELADAFRSAVETKLAGGRSSRAATVRAAIDRARQLDSRLHDLIAESCGNRFLAKELGRLQLLFRGFRDVAWDKRSTQGDLGRFAEEAREHLAIVEALLQGNAKAASTAMSRHIQAGEKYWSRGLPH